MAVIRSKPWYLYETLRVAEVMSSRVSELFGRNRRENSALAFDLLGRLLLSASCYESRGHRLSIEGGAIIYSAPEVFFALQQLSGTKWVAYVEHFLPDGSPDPQFSNIGESDLWEIVEESQEFEP